MLNWSAWWFKIVKICVKNTLLFSF